MFAANIFADTPRSQNPDTSSALSDAAFPPAILGQALINSDPKNPEGYKLLAADQANRAQWLDLLRTLDKAARNDVFDSSLDLQNAKALWALQDVRGNYNALVWAEVTARDNDK